MSKSITIEIKMLICVVPKRFHIASTKTHYFIGSIA